MYVGYTVGAIAAAAGAGSDWEDLAVTTLFEPLGRTRSSFRHADFLAHDNRARLHVRRGAGESMRWVAAYDRDADPQSPAGGASGSVLDVARFLRLQLGAGSFEGKPVVDSAALMATRLPHMVTSLPRTRDGRAGFYGLGWNVSSDDRGRLVIGHAGAF